VDLLDTLTIEVVDQNGGTIAEINNFPTDVLDGLLIVGKFEYTGLKWEVRDAVVHLEDSQHGFEHAWVVLEVI
jgi:hypothetical protein